MSPTIPAIPLTPSLSLSSPKGDDMVKVRELAHEFESMLLLQMIRQMRQSMTKSGDSDEESNGFGFGNETMTDTVDAELARQLSLSGGVGVADVIVDGFVSKHLVNPQPPTANTKADLKTPGPRELGVGSWTLEVDKGAKAPHPDVPTSAPRVRDCVGNQSGGAGGSAGRLRRDCAQSGGRAVAGRRAIDLALRLACRSSRRTRAVPPRRGCQGGVRHRSARSCTGLGRVRRRSRRLRDNGGGGASAGASDSVRTFVGITCACRRPGSGWPAHWAGR